MTTHLHLRRATIWRLSSCGHYSLNPFLGIGGIDTPRDDNRRVLPFASSIRNSSSKILRVNQPGIIIHQCTRRLFSRTSGINDTLLNKDEVEYLPEGITRQPDFFEEGITFIKNLEPIHIKSSNSQIQNQIQPSAVTKNLSKPQDISEAISSFDNMCLTIISKGCANIHEGNDGEGPEVKAWHASAISWAELLLHSSAWNRRGASGTSITAAPMLAVAAVAPVVAQGGIHYLHRIDELLAASSYADGSNGLLDMATYATSFRDIFVSSSSIDNNKAFAPILSPRERWHLHALYQLLQNDHRKAIGAYLRLLEFFPGDLLGLSLALDVAHTLGDADLALRAAANVSTYWTERDTGGLGSSHSHPGQTIATSLLSVGLASSSSSRASTAERLAETALSRDSDSVGGTAVWALAHVLASEGRSQEMVSRLATSDGVRLYESAGYLAFNTRMAGYGAISLLDTKRAGADRSASRLYDGSFGHVLQYSGNNTDGFERGGEHVCLHEMNVPTSVKDDIKGAVGSIFSGWFSSKEDSTETKTQHEQRSSTKERQVPEQRSVEAVLTWLPPSPILLTHATSLLLRLTLCDAISSSDKRWADIRAAWESTIKNSNYSLTPDDQTSIEFTPLALLAASLLFDPEKLHLKTVPPQLEIAMKSLHQLGQLMKFGQFEVHPATSKNDNTKPDEWRKVLTYISCAIDPARWEMPAGMLSTTYLPPTDNLATKYHIGWDFDTRQLLEYALCHAAIEAGDYESLCLAKAICSEGATLRSNCPEMWYRYAIIMEKLGDDVAAENARSASVSFGGGEGSSAFQ